MTPRGAAVLLAAGSGALALLAFVLPKLADGHAPTRQIRPLASPIETEPAQEVGPSVDLVSADAPPEEHEAKPTLVEEVLVATPAASAAAALTSPDAQGKGPAFKNVRAPGKVERISPEQSRERQKERGLRRKRNNEGDEAPSRGVDKASIPRSEKVDRVRNKAPGLAPKGKGGARNRTKAPGY